MEKRTNKRFLNGFWKLWRDDYLLSFRERTQNTLKTGRVVSHNFLKCDDILLVKEDLPRGCWNMGKVMELIVSVDGHLRSAKVKLHSGRIIGRPLKLLFPVQLKFQPVIGNIMILNETFLQQKQNRAGVPYTKQQNEREKYKRTHVKKTLMIRL